MTGSIGIVVGAVQIIVYLTTKSDKGPFSLGGGNVSHQVTVLLQFLAGLAGIAVMICGVMTIIALSDEADSPGVKWRDASKSENWKETDGSAYALGSYGMMLIILGGAFFLANLQATQMLKPLFGWHYLGLFGLALGICCLGAVGNTGILLGTYVIVVTGIMWVLCVLYTVQEGKYTTSKK